MDILPAIDLRGGRCVRLRQGDYDRETVFGDDPAAMAEHWQAQGATRIHLVDRDGAKLGHPVNVESVREILARVDVPCQLGGGIRDEETVETWLGAGLDRVVIGTQALRDPAWFREVALRHPGRILLGLDARDGRVATAGWLDVSTVAATDLAEQFDDL
ncbi:MAG TPA: HisA/HisF-related TIM barrel protein, partial [Isosphaeraceae bacterium]